ncbi:NifB/NifX family molybdenum-iron cluster-binding protein [Planctomycetota bacterium]
MKKIAVPIWNDCVSSVFDFADTVQLITLEDDRVMSRRDIVLAGTDALERSNRLIEAGPDVLLCGAISRCLADRIRIAGIEVLSLVCGPVDRVINAYLSRDLTQPEFRLPGCKEGSGRCARRGHGHCGRHE